MNPIIFTITGSLIFGALGFFIGKHTTKKKYESEIEEVYKECSEELTQMKHELDEFHRVFVTSQEPEVAANRERIWKKASEDIRKGRKALAEEPKEESDTPKDTDDGITKTRDEKDRINYQAIATTYATEPEEVDWRNPTKGIVRHESDVTNGIYEIEEWEYRDQNEYPLENFYYYEMSTDVYTEDEVLVDEDEVPRMFGYSNEELATRFLHEDEPQCIYVRNPEYERVYCIYICQGRDPDDHR